MHSRAQKTLSPKRHGRLTGIAALAFATLAATFAGASAAAAQTKVRIGLIGTNESQLPILIAKSKGFFKDENVEVETIHFKGGGVAVQALVGGSIELASFATDHVLRLANRGMETRFLIGIDRYITSTLVVRADKGITDFESLRGKTISVSAPGSYSDNTVRWALKSAGLNPDRDVTIVGIGTGNAARAGLESGQTDAAVVPTPDVLDYEINSPGKFKVIYDWRSIPHSGQAVIARKAWIDANLQAAKGIARAVLRAEQLIQTDPAVVEAAIREVFPDRNDAFVKAYAALVPKLLSPDGSISESGFDKMVEILQVVEPELKAIKKSDVDLTNQLLDRK